MKTRYLKIGIIIAVSVASIVIINEMFPNFILADDFDFYNTCDVILRENNTFYVFEDCKMEAFKPVKLSASFWSMELNQKLQEAIKIRDACIPVSGFDVDEIDGVLTIYFTEENESKYVDEIDRTITIPYVIKTTERPPSGATSSLRDFGCFLENMFEN